MFLATLLATAAVAAPTDPPAPSVTRHRRTLNGTVDAAGHAVYFEYGTTTVLRA